MKKIRISLLVIILLLSGNNLVAANADKESYFNFSSGNNAEIVKIKLDNYLFSDYIFSNKNANIKSFTFVNKKGIRYLVMDIDNCVFPRRNPHYRSLVDGKIVSRIAISQFTPKKLRIALRLNKTARYNIVLNEPTNSMEIHISSGVEKKLVERAAKQGIEKKLVERKTKKIVEKKFVKRAAKNNVEILINGTVNLMKKNGGLKAVQLWGKNSVIVFVKRQNVFYKYLMAKKTEQILCEKVIANDSVIDRYRKMLNTANGVKSKERQEKFARILEKIENHELKTAKKKQEIKKTPPTSTDEKKELPQEEVIKHAKERVEENRKDDTKISVKDKYNISGKLKNETAYRLNDTGFTKIKNVFELNSFGKISQDLSYTLGGKAHYDTVFSLTDNYPQNVKDDQERGIELRDAYFDFSMGNFDIRLGLQQIVWGEAIGVFIADVVHPWDLREYILPNLSDIRVPEWAANIEWYPGENHFQFVWVPFPEYSTLGVEGSEFDFLDRETENINYNKAEEPSNNLKNSKFGLKANRFFDGCGLDLSLFWLNKHDDLPTPFREIVVDPLTYSYTININPKHERINIFGATFSKDIGDDIVRGEFVYTDGKYFQVDDLSDKDGVIKKDSLDYLLGWNHTFFGKVDFNSQFMQRIILGHDKSITEDEIKSSVSLWIKTGFLNNTIEPEFTGIFSIDRTDYLLRPKINYNLSDNWKIACGADIFEGDEKGRGDFGRFEKNDRIYLKASYTF
ncbi:hypothetical protein KAU19_07360 [Candidatus Parcubacteria bacterium]|nr:hypothetical protein [Candidatus Parcubacteria bacterium]